MTKEQSDRKQLVLSRLFVGVRVLLGVAAVFSAARYVSAEDVPSFHRDGVLGTSFDLTVRGASAEQARQCERAVLAEIERLGKVLHTGDPASEISRLSVSREPFVCSADLFDVLWSCEEWRKRTSGSFNCHLGEVIDLWQAAAKAGGMPDKSQLDAAVATAKTPAWSLDKSTRTVAPQRPLHLRVAGLAKGYIIDKALAAGRAATPEAKGILLDIGGDIVVWSDPAAGKDGAWLVDVADPAHNADNAPPLATLRLTNQSVATSGSYARSVEIGGKRYSHILDPATGQPVSQGVGATVVAPDASDADALATALCVMSPARGVGLVNLLPDTECLVIGADGRKFVSRGWAALTAPTVATGGKPTAAPETPAAGQWPDGYAATITLALRTRSSKRPYVAVWVVDEKGRPLKTLAVWGDKSKYHKSLTDWYSLGDSFRQQARAVTRASRSSGAYTLAWDGTDGAGKAVPPGTYRVCIEIVGEKSGRAKVTGDIKCLAGPASITVGGSGELEGAAIKYGPKGA